MLTRLALLGLAFCATANAGGKLLPDVTIPIAGGDALQDLDLPFAQRVIPNILRQALGHRGG